MHQARVLVVDDDPVISAVLAQWLRSLHAQVDTADGVQEADAALARAGYDLILSDVHLPGNQRLKWVARTLSRAEAPPLLLMTSDPEVETAVLAANLPVAGYLPKPPDLAALGPLLQQLLDERRRRRALTEVAAALTNLEAGDEFRPALDALADRLRAVAPESRSAESIWRHAIGETIATLEKTKHSFRSKELGNLRRRLTDLLEGRVTPPSSSAATN